jgi:hypothetical protein
MTILAVASVLTRDTPPAQWWWSPVVLAIAAWVVEIQTSLIRELRDQLARRMEADR